MNRIVVLLELGGRRSSAAAPDWSRRFRSFAPADKGTSNGTTAKSTAVRTFFAGG